LVLPCGIFARYEKKDWFSPFYIRKYQLSYNQDNHII
jgi:hypothetical protein